MADPKLFRFETLSLHAGQRPDPTTGARAVPIYQTTSYVFRDVETPRRCSTSSASAISIRGSPTRPSPCWEERVAALEGGVGAVATASGHAALHLAIATLMGAGSHIVASSALYGGSVNLFRHYRRASPSRRVRAAARFRRLQAGDPARDAADLRRDHRQSRPELLDLEAVAEIAHEAGILLLIDLTFSTPLLNWPSSMALISCCIRRPNGWAAMASPSAACSSTAGASIGRNRRRSFRP
jgi:O-acetylhomoserine (thiol)-lyase